MITFLAQISDEDFANADAETQADILHSEIVRCKDCRWGEDCCRSIRSEGRRPDDYCSFGERKEADNA